MIGVQIIDGLPSTTLRTIKHQYFTILALHSSKLLRAINCLLRELIITAVRVA